jgi:hypothetical protein
MLVTGGTPIFRVATLPTRTVARVQGAFAAINRVKIAVVGRMDNRILTCATKSASSMEDAPLKALCALVFVLSWFAAPAQTLDASGIAAYYPDDCFGEITEPSMVPTQIVAAEPTIEKFGEAFDEADGVAIIGRNDAADVPVGALLLGDGSASVEYSTRSDDERTVDATAEQSAMPAEIVATEPTIEKFGGAFDEADSVAITGPNDAADVPVGATQPGDESPSVQYATRSDDERTVDGTTEQSTMPAEIVATEPTIEKVGGDFDEADSVAIAGPDDAADVPVGAIQPESPSVEYATRSDDKRAVDETTEQSTMPAQIIATEPWGG